MYQIKEIGVGKKVCNADGVTHLYHTLSQAKLKRLFSLNCEFIEYVKREDKREETKKFEEVPATKESTKDNGTSFARRKQYRRKGTNKSKKD